MHENSIEPKRETNMDPISRDTVRGRDDLPLPHDRGPAHEEVDAQTGDLPRPQEGAHVRPLAEPGQVGVVGDVVGDADGVKAVGVTGAAFGIRLGERLRW